jgi:mevalonate kinase
MTQTYHANGKLLLTGEYFILDGAVGLALPTKFGQTLTVRDRFSEEHLDNNPSVIWQAHEKKLFDKSVDYACDQTNPIWIEFEKKGYLKDLFLYFEMTLSNFKIIEEENEVSLRLANIFKELRNLDQSFLKDSRSLKIETYFDFPQNWGLGSSSTLISLLSQWSGVDAYELLAKTFGGSGYDIACATANTAITYQLTTHDSRLTTAINFQPSFSNHLYFVHLGKKQNSREGIQHYKNLTIDKTEYIEQISEITQKLIHANELDEFCYYLEVHENIVGNVLNLRKVKEIYFSDFPGTVKSLGAWGGDFILVASDESPEMITRYFQQKGFSTILSYKDMIL